MTTVGPKYQVVMVREARHKLGIRPSWVAVQTVVDDHLELRFLPPEHDRSLAGSLHQYASKPVVYPADEEQAAWQSHVDETWGSE